MLLKYILISLSKSMYCRSILYNSTVSLLLFIFSSKENINRQIHKQTTIRDEVGSAGLNIISPAYSKERFFAHRISRTMRLPSLNKFQSRWSS